jgi:putative MFS transporter
MSVSTPEAKVPSPTRILITSGIGTLFDSMDVLLFSYILVSLSRDWHLSSGTMGVLGSLALLGMAIGSALSGSLADRFGRRNMFMWTLLLYSIASGLSGLVATAGILMLLRFLTGLGLGGELPVSTTYVLESSKDENRGRRVVLLEMFWAFGSLVAAIIAFFVIPSIGWRAAFLIGTIPALYTIYLRISLPETPRYRSLPERPTIRQSFAKTWSKGIGRRTAVTWTLWFTMNYAYYGLFTWLPTIMANKGYSLVHSIGYVLIMTLAQVPGYLTAAWLVEKWGRKKTLVIAIFLSALAALGFGFATSTVMLILFGLLISYFMLGAWAGTYIFTVEQFPTAARATGMGWSAGIGRIGGVLAPMFTGLLLGAKISFPIIFGIFFVVLLVGAIIVGVFGLETKGKQLE